MSDEVGSDLPPEFLAWEDARRTREVLEREASALRDRYLEAAAREEELLAALPHGSRYQSEDEEAEVLRDATRRRLAKLEATARTAREHLSLLSIDSLRLITRLSVLMHPSPFNLPVDAMAGPRMLQDLIVLCEAFERLEEIDLLEIRAREQSLIRVLYGEAHGLELAPPATDQPQLDAGVHQPVTRSMTPEDQAWVDSLDLHVVPPEHQASTRVYLVWFLAGLTARLLEVATQARDKGDDWEAMVAREVLKEATVFPHMARSEKFSLSRMSVELNDATGRKLNYKGLLALAEPEARRRAAEVLARAEQPWRRRSGPTA